MQKKCVIFQLVYLLLHFPFWSLLFLSVISTPPFPLSLYFSSFVFLVYFFYFFYFSIWNLTIYKLLVIQAICNTLAVETNNSKVHQYKPFLGSGTGMISGNFLNKNPADNIMKCLNFYDSKVRYIYAYFTP